MDPKTIQKTMLEGMRSGMLMYFDAMNSMQEQMEKMWKTVIEQSGDVRKEGEKVLQEWLDNMRKGREDLRRNLDEGVRKMESLLTQE